MKKKEANDISDILGLGGLASLGVDTGLDMNYLMGDGSPQDEEKDEEMESSLDDDESEELGSQDDKSEHSDSDDNNQSEEKDDEGTFAVPESKKPSKNKDSVRIGERKATVQPMAKDDDDMKIPKSKRKKNLDDEFKIPTLYYSKPEGQRFRLSEALLPQDPAVMKATLAFNYEIMMNKLMELGNEGTKDIKKKLLESLPEREKQQLRVIKDMSMRTLLKELLYFHSDLSSKQHEWILKEIRKDKRMREFYQRNIISVQEACEYFAQLRKQQDHEEEQRKKEVDDKLKQLNNASEKKVQEPILSEIDLRCLNLPIQLQMSKNPLGQLDNPLKSLNEVSKTMCVDSQDECSQGNLDSSKANKDFEIGPHKEKVVELDAKKQEESKMKPFNPLNNVEALSPRTIMEIKKKLDTSTVYDSQTKKDEPIKKELKKSFIVDESNQFLSSFSFNNLNEEEKDEGNNKGRYENVHGSTQVDQHKDDADDLFASNEPSKGQANNQPDLFDDDLFGNDNGNAAQNADDDDDEFFGPSKNDVKDDDDDMFGDSNADKDKSSSKSNRKDSIGDAGDFFIKAAETRKAPRDDDTNGPRFTKSTYFGELKDVPSLFMRKRQKKEAILKATNMSDDTSFDMKIGEHKVIHMIEKSKIEDTRHKSLNESLILENFRSSKSKGTQEKKRFNLKPLTAEDKVNTKLVMLDTDKKRRELKFDYQENFDYHLSHIAAKMEAKKKREEDAKVILTKNGQVQPQDGDKDKLLLDDTQDLDDVSSIDSDTKAEEKKYRSIGGIFAGDLDTLNGGVSDVVEHARCYVLEWIESDYDRFHRPDLGEITKSLEAEREKSLKSSEFRIEDKLRMSNIGSWKAYKNQELAKAFSMKAVLQSRAKLRAKAKKSGIMNASDYFKDRYKLSLKVGKFLVFEHLDQYPMFISDFGMASKLNRYVYSDKVLPLSYFKHQPNGMAKTRHMGYYGQQILLNDMDPLPLIGELDRSKYQGLTVLENNLYRAPACYHKPKQTDFLCVVHRDRKKEKHIFIREMKQIYTLGQIEPKQEVYAPGSRAHGLFLKRKVQAFALKIMEYNNGRMPFFDLRKNFSFFNDQVLKKALKEVEIEVDRVGDAYFKTDFMIEDKIKTLITPENVCQYESAEFAKNRLTKLGIKSITNANRITFAVNKFCSETDKAYYRRYARLIEEELLSTPWHLSQSFLNNKDVNMMQLSGIGDPSNGYGGYSYLKMPLKASQDNLNKEKLPQSKSVTGTEADLRKLSKEKIRNILRNLGFDKDYDISHLPRWEGVKILRLQSSKAAKLGVAGSYSKFARGFKQSAKMHKENYQRDVNELFARQLDIITSPKPDIPEDNECKDFKLDKNKAIKDKFEIAKKMHRNEEDKEEQLPAEEAKQGSTNQSKYILETTQDVVINSIYDIPGFTEEFRQTLKDNYGEFSDGTLKCSVLKKVISAIDPITDQEVQKYQYIFDSKNIKGFRRRVEKCKNKSLIKRSNTKKGKNYGSSKGSKSVSFKPIAPRGDGVVTLNLQGINGLDDDSDYSKNQKSGRSKPIRAEYANSGRITIPLSNDDDEEYKDYDSKFVLNTGDVASSMDSKDMQAPKKKKAKKKDNTAVDQYLLGPKRQNTGSRRRQNTPESQFNESIGNIIDSCIFYDNTALFHYPVKKRDYPAYYDKVQTPMDLNTMKSKAKRCEYTSIQQFMDDLKLLHTNSIAFNGEHHFISHQAAGIVEKGELMAQSDMEVLEAQEKRLHELNS